MRAASALLALAVALGAAGCTLLFEPDRDMIRPDLDGSVDGGTEDAGDAGETPDAGPDGGSCVPQAAEDCTDPAGADEDCDGQSNCFDYDCRGVAACCRPGSASTPRCLESLADFVRLPADHAGDIQFSDTLCGATTRVTEFGPAGRARALVTQRCQPITFGMQLSVALEITEACTGACDYAALAFGPVQTFADGAPFPSELRVVLRGDGSAGVDRAGTPIGEQRPVGTFSPGQRVTVRVDLEPGPDESGQDVLFATVDLAVMAGPGGGRVLSRTAVAPLEALECIRPGGGRPGVGLYAAVEGAGGAVEVVGPLSTLERRCSNPSQFYESTESIDLSQAEACAAGGVGAPALVGYCRGNCDTAGPAVQWDLWVDASRTPRVEESFRFVDFGVCGYGWQTPIMPETPSWIARPQSPFMIGDAPSSREPTVMPVSDDGAGTRVRELAFAHAQRVAPLSEVYAIHGGTIDQRLTLAPAPFAEPLLAPGTSTGCVSLRDPLLVPWYEPATGGTGYRVRGAWLLFTCEHEGSTPDSIGVARLDGLRDRELRLVEGSIRANLLTATPSTYSARGVFAPEGFVEVQGEPGAEELVARLWYMARDGTGQVRLAYAQGRASGLDAFPELDPYPANPILAGDSRALGECTSACTLTGATVTPSLRTASEWQFVISRSRLTATGTVHELVPLLQPAPND